LFIIVIIPFLSYLFFNNKNKEVKTKTLPKWDTLIPLFVIGFLLFSLIITIRDITSSNSRQPLGIFNSNTWETLYDCLRSFGTLSLYAMAIARVRLYTAFNLFMARRI